MAKENDITWFKKNLLERFLRYVKIDTTSDRHSQSEPTTEGQLKLARTLVKELEELGLSSIKLDEKGFLFASLFSNLPPGGGREEPPEIGFMAHLDTSDAVPGNAVEPVIHENYQGGIIQLKEGV